MPKIKLYLISIMKYFYAIARGRKTGIFTTCNECKQHIDNFNGASYKKFTSESDANIFIKGNGSLILGQLGITQGITQGITDVSPDILPIIRDNTISTHKKPINSAKDAATSSGNTSILDKFI